MDSPHGKLEGVAESPSAAQEGQHVARADQSVAD
jgi:hypothetical protein